MVEKLKIISKNKRGLIQAVKTVLRGDTLFKPNI